MIYRTLADIVLIAHVAFVLFAALGGLLALRRPRVIWLHLPALMWGILVQLANWTCPLTPLENWFRQLGGASGYTGGFVEHYVSAILYPENLTYALRVWLGLFLITVNLVVYSFVLFRWRQMVKQPQRTSTAN